MFVPKFAKIISECFSVKRVGGTIFIIYFKFHRILYCYLVMADFGNFKLIQEQ